MTEKIRRIDCHVHSGLSDGQGGLAEIIEAALAAGLEAVAVTDHYDPADPRQNAPQADLAAARLWADAAWAEHRLKVRIGLEVGPGFSPGATTRFWPIIASVHSLNRSAADLFDPFYWDTYKLAVLNLAAAPGIDILGHPAGYLPFPAALVEGTTYEQRLDLNREIARRFLDRSWYEELARRAVRTGRAVEIHAPTRSPEPEMLRVLRRNGVRFSMGSDAHSLSRVGDVDWALDALAQAGGGNRDLLEV